MKYPPWVVLHVPHDSVEVPLAVRDQFLPGDDELRLELIRMTDHQTLAMFSDPWSAAAMVSADVSRLVVDVERFQDDRLEPMAARGMGAIYALTSHEQPLRRELSDDERDSLIQRYYRAHHDRLEAAVATALDAFNRCLVIDCHSFPSTALPYERAEPAAIRPDICIGTDDFHTSAEFGSAFVAAFQREGWRVSLNDPFAGALVPSSRYRGDRRVEAVMVEINRGLYLRETDATATANFDDFAQRVRNCCIAAIAEVTC